MKLKILPFLFLGLCFYLPVAAQETAPVNGVYNRNHDYYAFTNATIVVDFQTTIQHGTLLIRDGLVVEVGEKVNIPKGSVVTDLKGKYIYPSLIDIYTNYGLPEIKKLQRQGFGQADLKRPGAFAWNAAIKPEIESAKLFTVDTKSAEEMRKLGFGTVMTFSRDGIVRGSGAVVTLANGTEREVLLLDKAAALYSFDKGTSLHDYPSSQMGAIALLRQTYYDAAWYKQNKNKNIEQNISLDVFNGILNLPQIFEVNDKQSALRAANTGKEFNVRYIIKGAGDEYQRMEDIKNTFSAYIVPLNFPMVYDVEDSYDAALVSLEDLKHWEMAPFNPTALYKNGVNFALTTFDLKEKKDFWKNLRKAIQYGLPEKEALKALTFEPAKMLQVSDKVGSLKKGMLANFIITSANLFDEKNIIYQNWIQGNPYVVNSIDAIDVRGNYDLTLGDKLFALKISGDLDKPKGSLTLSSDSIKTLVNISVSKRTITLSFKQKKDSLLSRLSGTIDENPLYFNGNGQGAKGEELSWKAAWKSEYKLEEKKDSLVKTLPKLGEVIYPFITYGMPAYDENLWQQFKNRWDAILIKNVTVWTNEPEGVLKNKDVYITEGRIVRIADNIEPTKLAFAKVIDGIGKHLTPGIIDEHSHIAVNGGVNEGGQAVSAEVRIGDVINCEDINIYRQLAGGVTTSQLLHGSANPIGGQSAIIKLRWGKSAEEMKYRGADGFIKFALGENVKQSNFAEGSGRFPKSRMGVEQMYFDAFYRAKEYQAKWLAYDKLSSKEKIVSPRKDLELETLSEILNKKRFITCHSYVQSEINMLLHVADSMKFKVNTFTHILEGYKVADKMKAHGVAASTFSDWWSYKMEVAEAIPYNAAILTRMGITTAINSDDAEMGRRLNQEAAKTVKYGGLTEEEALKLVTLNPAKILHLDNRVGSIKVGKDADLVLWSDHPLSIYAKAEKTIIDGIIYFDIERDQKLREYIARERIRLIQKMIAEKNGGANTQKPKAKVQQLYECETLNENE